MILCCSREVTAKTDKVVKFLMNSEYCALARALRPNNLDLDVGMRGLARFTDLGPALEPDLNHQV